MDNIYDWQKVFNESCDFLFDQLKTKELLICSFSAEESDFIRFNNSKVRQITNVVQGKLSLELIVECKKLSLEVTLNNQAESNKLKLEQAIQYLQETIVDLPDDPFIQSVVDHGKSNVVNQGVFPVIPEILQDISKLTHGVDVAGLWASGYCYRGNRNSLGQSHWFVSSSFFFDYSLYTTKERAIKGNYSGTKYLQEELATTLEESKKSLSIMERNKIHLKPGTYRCYLAPSAVVELVNIWSWGGFSGAASKRGESFISDYLQGNLQFSPLLSLDEDFSLGLRPRFNELGEVSENLLPLISQGKVIQLLVSTKTEKEFGISCNYASSAEAPRSPCIHPGNMPQAEIISRLGTGIYISNLHYLNWSDRQAGRITGMTRFGCLWVEDGKVLGPIQDMRFDELIPHIFGDGLEAVTEFTETSVEIDTYRQRNIGGSKVPGLLVNGIEFTL